MKTRRLLAFLLAMAMCVSMLNTGAFAAEETTTIPNGSFTFNDSVADLKVSENARSFYFTFDFDETVTNFMTFNLKVTGGTGDASVSANQSENEGSVFLITTASKNNSKDVTWSVEHVQGTYAAASSQTATMKQLDGFDLNIPANAYGTFNITLEVTQWGYYTNYETNKNDESKTYYVDLDDEPITYTTAVTVAEPVKETAPYEIYYTLNSETDDLAANGAAGTDKYMEYDVSTDAGKTVTATVYMKNNTDAAVTMQAYDIYLSYSNLLTYVSETLAGDVYYNSTTAEAGADNKMHIQLVKNTTTIELGSEPVSLGSIVFKFADDAAYGEKLNITLTADNDGDNTEEEKEVTNFSVGDAVEGETANGEGDAASYYPVDTSAVYGAEINTTYTVKYELDGGTGTFADQVKQHNVDLTLHEADPTKEGYKFTGWKANDDAGTTYGAGAEYTANANVTLTAQWKQNTFKVYWYNTDGNEIYSADVNVGATTSFDSTNYTAPSKAADAQYTYTLKGWSTDSEAGLNADVVDLTTYKIEAETKFYPVFATTTNTYTVTWNNWDNSLLEKDENVAYGTTPEYNSATPTKAETAQYNYTFDGWNPEVSKVTGDVTYTAKFKEELRSYTVTFNENGHGTAPATQTIEYGSKATNPGDLTADHYTFGGWYTDPGCADSTAYDFDAPVVTNVTLYAKWTAKTYTVTFEAGEGSGSMEEQTFTYGESKALTANGFTAPTGKTFDGWKDQDGENYTDKQSVSLTKDITLTAQWSSNSYTVSADDQVQNGTVTVDKASANYNDKITVTVKPADGYDVDTVSYTPAGGTAQTITAVDGIYSFSMPDANVTVSATFKAIDYTVTVTTPANGTVTANMTEQAHVGDEITLTATPATGYKWASYTVTYKDAEGNDQPVTVTDGKFTMPAANVTVTATFVGIEYTVKFDDNTDDTTASGTVNDITATFGESIVLGEGKYSRTGYTFLGWATTSNATEATYQPNGTITETIFTPTAEGESVTLYAVWQVNTYKITVENSANGSVTTDVADNENVAFGTTVTLTATGNVGYMLDYYTVTDTNNAEVTVTDGKFTMPASNVTVTATFKAIEYNVNLDNSDTTEGTVSADKVTATMGTVVTLSNKPAGGYELDKYTVTDSNNAEVTVTDGQFTMPASAVTVKATFKVINYTITLNANGGTVEPNTITYNVTQSVNLPTPTRDYYDFAGWDVTEAGGNWDANGAFNKDTTTIAAGKYGNVTLTAQWTRKVTPVVEEYKYAASGYWMIRVADALDEGKEYKFNGQSMYWIENANYAVDGNSKVFYTLVEAKYVDTTNKTLTDEGYKLLTTGDCTARTKIEYNGDINADGVLNIADANIVYQMTIYGGNYYGSDKLDVKARLHADMDKAAAEYRASIEDVNDIVDLINGTAN